jgi:hypothetical protein
MKENAIINRLKMMNYRHLPATALFKDNLLFIAGGQVNGEWSKEFEQFNVETLKSNFLR